MSAVYGRRESGRVQVLSAVWDAPRAHFTSREPSAGHREVRVYEVSSALDRASRTGRVPKSTLPQ